MNRRYRIASKFINDLWTTRNPSPWIATCKEARMQPSAFASCTTRGLSHDHKVLHCPRRIYPPCHLRSYLLNSTNYYHEGKGGVETLQGYNLTHKQCNIPSHIAARVGTNIHLQLNHPLNIIKNLIENYWQQRDSSEKFHTFDTLSPIVSTHENFDSLLIPSNHISRSKSDTYYLREDLLLRTHTSAHQTNLLKQGLKQFLVTGDVYRRDEIDSSHYPIFHQMEGVKIFTKDELIQSTKEEDRLAFVVNDLKQGLEGMVHAMFGNVQVRWIDTYFPFTLPSFELEIFFNGSWLEVLGCGVVHRDILASVGRADQLGWAFGLGLERLAMVLFSIPDIRLFWTTDDRFKNQFKDGKIVKFQSFSKFPPCLKDLSFWIPNSFHPNDLNVLRVIW